MKGLIHVHLGLASIALAVVFGIGWTIWMIREVGPAGTALMWTGGLIIFLICITRNR